MCVILSSDCYLTCNGILILKCDFEINVILLESSVLLSAIFLDIDLYSFIKMLDLLCFFLWNVSIKCLKFTCMFDCYAVKFICTDIQCMLHVHNYVMVYIHKVYVPY